MVAAGWDAHARSQASNGPGCVRRRTPKVLAQLLGAWIRQLGHLPDCVAAHLVSSHLIASHFTSSSDYTGTALVQHLAYGKADQSILAQLT